MEQKGKRFEKVYDKKIRDKIDGLTTKQDEQEDSPTPIPQQHAQTNERNETIIHESLPCNKTIIYESLPVFNDVFCIFGREIIGKNGVKFNFQIADSKYGQNYCGLCSHCDSFYL